jgi:hypothetical protein
MNSSHGKGKILRVLVVVVLLGVIGFFTGRYILYVKIRNTIEHELGSLRKQGIHVTYDNLEVYPWDGKIEVHELTVKIRKDSLGRDSTGQGMNAYLPYITLEGFDLVPFLREKTISVHKIHSYETYLTYRINSTLFEHDKREKRKIEINNISVREVNFPRIDFYLTDEFLPDTVAHILTDVHMKDLFLAKQLDSLTWQKGQVDISGFAMNYTKENYGFSVSKINLGISDKSITIDSLRIKPLVDKREFMRTADRQCTYMEALIPSLKITSIDWYTFPTATLQMDRMDLSMRAIMYRDKRLPFLQRNDRALPSHLLHRLPIQIKVDTIKLKDSYVLYEEMPESGDSTGAVFFDNLNATIMNVHNNKKLKVDAKMHATAKFMGEGDLNAFFTFPYDTLQQYRANGTLKNFPLMTLNNILGSAAKTKIESGTMRNLEFKFAYNNYRSDGEVEMNYEDLKILSLRENRKNEQSVSRIKTLLLNTLILGKKIDEDAKDDTRKGTIEFSRDTKKSVFNFWWKSVLSGIKSAYNLDKLPIAAAGEKKHKKKKPIKEVLSKIFR